MPSRTPWPRILQAGTTSQALHLAADVSIPDLSEAPLPVKYKDLSLHSQKNARAVRRALGVPIPGLSQSGWEDWGETEEDAYLAEHENLLESNVVYHGDGWESDDIVADSDAPVPKVRRVTGKAALMKDHCNKIQVRESITATAGEADKITTSADNTGRETKERQKPDLSPKPTPVEMKHAEALKVWARTSPHTEPPKEAVQVVSRCTAVAGILAMIVPQDAVSELLAPIVRVLAENIGTSFASHVMSVLMIPYIKALRTPASRDVMDAVVLFSKRHWRPTLSLFETFADGNGAVVNGATAEILVRVTTVLSADGAMQAFRAFCKGPWGEDGVRVVEALLGRCKNETGVAGILISALQINVIGAEKSVRFGKLLFMAAKDVPGITGDHGEAMEAVCLRSKVFLAKRAVALVQSRKEHS